MLRKLCQRRLKGLASVQARILIGTIKFNVYSAN